MIYIAFERTWNYIYAQVLSKNKNEKITLNDNLVRNLYKVLQLLQIMKLIENAESALRRTQKKILT
jgi:hypothetical protein